MKHQIIYEEERCLKCKNYYKHLSNLNKRIKLYEHNSDENLNITKQISKLSSNFSRHKESHNKLSADKIDSIVKEFILIREELRETISLDMDMDDNIDNESFKPYQPTSFQRSKIPKKRMF